MMMIWILRRMAAAAFWILDRFLIANFNFYFFLCFRHNYFLIWVVVVASVTSLTETSPRSEASDFFSVSAITLAPLYHSAYQVAGNRSSANSPLIPRPLLILAEGFTSKAF
jgi:hypothetical protein